MVFLGVPIFDWVLLLVLLGFGVEAYMTCRTRDDDEQAPKSTAEGETPDTPDAPAKPVAQDHEGSQRP